MGVRLGQLSEKNFKLEEKISALLEEIGSLNEELDAKSRLIRQQSTLLRGQSRAPVAPSEPKPAQPKASGSAVRFFWIKANGG